MSRDSNKPPLPFIRLTLLLLCLVGPSATAERLPPGVAEDILMNDPNGCDIPSRGWDQLQRFGGYYTVSATACCYVPLFNSNQSAFNCSFSTVQQCNWAPSRVRSTAGNQALRAARDGLGAICVGGMNSGQFQCLPSATSCTVNYNYYFSLLGLPGNREPE